MCCAVLATIGFSSVAAAQCKNEITIKSVRRNGSAPTYIYVLLNTPKQLSAPQKAVIENANNWLVFNPDAIGAASTASFDARQQALRDSVIPVVLAAVQPTNENPVTQIEVIVSLQARLADKNNYLVKINQLASPDCIQAPTVIKSLGAASGSSSSATKTTLAKSKDRKESDIYIQGLAEGAHKQKTFFTVDALVKRKFRFGPKDYLEPVFELKTSTSKKADPDSASLGVNYIRTVGVYKDFLSLRSFDFANGAKLESDTDFKNVNLLYQTRADFAFEKLSYANGSQAIEVNPFIGFELGRNLKSPVAEAENRLLARPLFGANLYVQFFSNDEKVLAFETQFTRRLLLRREVAFKTDNDNFIALPISSKPRDYIKSSLNFDFSKNFGFSATYEYGQLPPKYALVDSKFGFGLLFKGKFNKAPQ